MPLEDYEIRLMEDHEKRVVLNFLTRHFFANEYLMNVYFAKNKAKINEDEARTIEQDFHRKYEFLVNDHPCHVVVHRDTQNIVGINMMSLMHNPQKATNDNHAKSAGQAPLIKSKIASDWFTNVLYSSICAVDFFQEMPAIDTTLEIVFLGVDTEHAGKGLATALTREAVDLAKRRNVDVVFGLFTSPFSYRASKTVGFKTCREIDVMSFRDADGNIVYEGTGPYQIFITSLVLK